MEKNIVPQKGYPLKLLRSRGFEKGFSSETLEAVKGIFDSWIDSRKLLKQEKPDLVIGTGGFTSAMLLIAASLKKIPTMIHEQNAYPGRSNRLTSKFVDKIAISFPEAEKYFNPKKTFLAGNPIRNEFKELNRDKSREKLGLKSTDKLVIFMGGSQGAEAINQAALYTIENYNEPDIIYYILAGKDNYKTLKDKIDSLDIDKSRIKIFDYYNDMSNLLAAGDLIISRSGAMSITEIAACGIPSILIPFPNAAGDHQTFNAKVISENGGGVLIPESQLTGELLLKNIKNILENQDRLGQMRARTLEKKILDADERFCNEAYNLVQKIKKN